MFSCYDYAHSRLIYDLAHAVLSLAPLTRVMRCLKGEVIRMPRQIQSTTGTPLNCGFS